MTTSSPNFASILDESPDHVEIPPTLPVGTYLCTVGAPRYDKSSNKGTDFVEFPLKVVMALDDVAAADLEEFGSLEDKTLRTTYYLTEDAVYRLDEFHVHCGLDLTISASRRIRNDECINAQVLAVVSHRVSQDKTRTFADVKRTAPAQD